MIRPDKTKRLLYLLILFSSFVLLSGCCTNCLIARSELAGQEDLEQSNPRATEIWAGDIDSVITSEYGGNLQSLKLDEVSPLTQLSGYWNSDLLLYDDSGRELKIKKVELYDSAKKATVIATSTLSNTVLKLQKSYRMNFDTGDIYAIKIITNTASSPVSLTAMQQITLAKGGYFIIPVNVASRYPHLYEITDSSGKDITESSADKIHKSANKILYKVDENSPELTINSDSTEGWFGYFYKDTLLLVKFSPFYTNLEKKDKVIFRAQITKDSVKCTFGETYRNLPEKGSCLKLYEKTALVELKDEINNFEDIYTALKYLKLSLIARR
ncbi:MAG TPA: hypothetical protein DD381_11570 [Lentisphaeria bacterium]|nr:MAG: hypothetical protein A2X47_10105 [Lentisphaerae bacterium GWF2_38_69]HBM16967.1 hypothetical protein [Lentisphaeria bacterium]